MTSKRAQRYDLKDSSGLPGNRNDHNGDWAERKTAQTRQESPGRAGFVVLTHSNASPTQAVKSSCYALLDVNRRTQLVVRVASHTNTNTNINSAGAAGVVFRARRWLDVHSTPSRARAALELELARHGNGYCGDRAVHATASARSRYKYTPRTTHPGPTAHSPNTTTCVSERSQKPQEERIPRRPLATVSASARPGGPPDLIASHQVGHSSLITAAAHPTSFVDMSALAASQLGTTHAGFGIADRSAFRLHGVTAARPRVPAGAEAPLAMRTGAARPTPPRHARRTQQQRPGGRRLPSLVVCAAATGGMNIVFVGAEMAPWSKTGGLGDVLGGLPPAMAANGHRVMVISPRYDQYKDAWDTSVVAEIKVADRYERVRFFHCYKRGVDRVFIDHPSFLEKVWGKTGEKIYGPDTGIDYKDNQMRFSLLCQAALEAPRILNLNSNPYFSGPYGEDVVFVCNDWHTGPLSCYLKTNYHPNGNYRGAKVAFCIHNISYQGRFALADFGELNLPERFKSSFDFLDGYDTPVEGRKINWMKAGILEADRVLTAMEAKALNKEALQAAVGLPVDRKIPLIAFVGRLEEQKGPDVMAAAIPEILEEEDVQIVLLGTGKKKFERLFKAAEEKYPDKVAAIVKFNAPLAHHIMAGADLLAVTSRFEPCGLIQLQGMRYGTPCACASTGGLVDTVVEGKTGFQMGRLSVDCKVVEPADVKKVTTTLKRAIKVVGTPAYNEMVRNCMTQDLSWKGPAKNWENVLLSMGVAGSEPGIEGEEIAPLARENVAAP
ncbi:hypothetical protein PR202_ga18269 [Eleusine coracana subsp. coracana]|uniref:NDP-glucose--starch glucosyltransferase n=5 Tax=Eleusine TaxID=4510 RepID=A0AAV5CSQ8_ELECO|nr:hypothetical protein PR202_ga18269 [Eleusine coracana subsp. coracana]